jgi:hypothetical protein
VSPGNAAERWKNPIAIFGRYRSRRLTEFRRAGIVSSDAQLFASFIDPNKVFIAGKNSDR